MRTDTRVKPQKCCCQRGAVSSAFTNLRAVVKTDGGKRIACASSIAARKFIAVAATPHHEYAALPPSWRIAHKLDRCDTGVRLPGRWHAFPNLDRV